MRGAEVMAVIGPALVRVRVDGDLQDIGVPEGEAYQFQFPPGVPHAIKGTGTGPMILISFNSVAHDPDHPDVVRDALL